MNNNHSIQLSTKTIVWVISVLFGLVILIVALNVFDKNRKYDQFIQINKELNMSDYPAKLDILVRAFTKTDTSHVKKIKELLDVIQKDIKDIDIACVYLKDTTNYIKIESGIYYEGSELFYEQNYLSTEMENLISFLNKPGSSDFEKMYEFLKDNSSVSTMVRINDHSYLYVEKYRE